MAFVLISPLVYPALADELTQCGHRVLRFYGSGISAPVNNHPDMFVCRLPGGAVCAQAGELCEGYPGETAFNALYMDGKVFVRTNSASKRLLEEIQKRGLDTVNVNQGYPVCSVCKISESAAITADMGMFSALTRTGIKVLRISPGNILLPGYGCGFIGGCAGLVGGRLYFNGDPALHPDADKILPFLEENSVKYSYVRGLPLLDTGGIVALGQKPEESDLYHVVQPLDL